MREEIAEKVASGASTITYFGASTGLVGWAASIDILTWLGVAIAILGFIVNFYYKIRDDRRANRAELRAEELHRLEIMRISKNAKQE